MLSLEDRRFYVYVYLDPTKSGNYKYGEYEFEAEPFYVGKGSGKRIYMSKSRYKLNSFKYNKIQKLKNLGYEPIILKYMECLTENEAFDFEIDMIKVIGRRDRKLGPLTNLTEGGEGTSGHIVKQETRKKISESEKGEKNHNYKRQFSEEHKRKISNAHKGKDNNWLGRHHSEEAKNKISEKNRGRKSSRKGKHLSEETKRKISKANKGKKHPRWNDEMRKKFSEAQKGEKNHNYGKSHSEETKKKMSINGSSCKPVIINGKYYYCVSNACKRLNIPYSTMLRRLKKRLKNKNFPNYKYASAA